MGERGKGRPTYWRKRLEVKGCILGGEGGGNCVAALKRLFIQSYGRHQARGAIVDDVASGFVSAATVAHECMLQIHTQNARFVFARRCCGKH
jgi:hypothetical protein